MNIRDLQYAVAVAELGHFGRAAARCHVSQPALSGQIRKLEDHLGVQLFERTNRRVAVTPVGAAIIDQARAVLERIAAIEDTARASADPLSGTLRLGMIHTIGPYITPLLLPSLRHGLPKATVDLVESTTAMLEADLIDGRIDAALLATAPGDARLTEIPLYTEPFWVALPGGHPLAAEDEIDLAAVDPGELLLLAEGHCLRDQALALCAEVGRDPVGAQQTSLATILALVGAGAGITLVPAMCLRGPWLTDAGIAMRKARSGAAARQVRLVFRRSYPRRALVEKLADIICAIVPDTVRPERR